MKFFKDPLSKKKLYHIKTGFKYKLSQEEMNTYTHKRQLGFQEELERYIDWWVVVSF